MQGKGGKRGNRILIVNDDAAARRSIVATLSGRYEVLESGARASRTLGEAIGRHPPDLALLDISDPGASGQEVCHTLKAHALTCSMPVIFHFGVVGPDGRPAGGADMATQTKPLRVEDLPALVARTLRDTEKNRHRLAAGLGVRGQAIPVPKVEIGAIQRAIQAIREAHDYLSIGDALLAACAELGLTAMTRIRGRHGVQSRNGRGEVTPFDAALLDKLSCLDGIVDFHSCAVINRDPATLVLTGLPRADGGRSTRLFDYLTLLIHYATDRVRELDRPVSAIARREPAPISPRLPPLAA
jgi:CheY-like chemotaxis protein